MQVLHLRTILFLSQLFGETRSIGRLLKLSQKISNNKHWPLSKHQDTKNKTTPQPWYSKQAAPPFTVATKPDCSRIWKSPKILVPKPSVSWPVFLDFAISLACIKLRGYPHQKVFAGSRQMYYQWHRINLRPTLRSFNLGNDARSTLLQQQAGRKKG